jgi:shikimate kinase
MIQCMEHKKIFLVGMPASGKSTIGKLLAGQLRLAFHDLDHLIAEREKKTIAEMFDQHGEPYFRELERDCLLEFLLKNTSYVLATGGGTPCFFDNMAIMNSYGTTVFLDVNIMDIHTKLASKRNQKRPLLAGKSSAELEQELLRKYEERKPFYNQSKICLSQRFGDSPGRTNEVLASIKMLEKQGEGKN